MLILDTNHIEVLKHNSERRNLLVSRLKAANGHEIATTIITVQETFDGWNASLNGKNVSAAKQVVFYDEMHKLIQFYAKWKVLPFDEAAAEQYEILKSKHKQIEANDLKISAIAICHKAIVLTRNIKDYKGVLKENAQDWLLDDPVEECTW